MFRSINRAIFLIVAAGLLLRLLFVLFLAESFYGNPNFWYMGDSDSWANGFINLWETGTFTVNPGHEYGYFVRMPGFSLYYGLFYLLAGADKVLAFTLTGWFQIFLDTATIYLVYALLMRMYNHKRMALIAAALYAFYPFAIVWTPVAISETLSNFLFFFLLFAFAKGSVKSLILSGALLGFAGLVRPQFLLLVPVLLLILFVRSGGFGKFRLAFSRLVIYSFAVLMIYGWWPARNYFIHGKPILTQELRGSPNWDLDVQAFIQYIYAVKAEWEPQFSAIIQNKEVTFPDDVYLHPEDSLLLHKTILLCQYYGSGFSHWRGYWKEPFDEPNENKLIAESFHLLRERQIRENPVHVFLTVPLKNLSKAVFKNELYDSASLVRRLASLLFYYRTILLLLGFGVALFMLYRRLPYSILFVLFPLILYGLLCFGTTVQMRNIEMRYFLLADIILLIPVAWLLSFLLFRKAQKSGPSA